MVPENISRKIEKNSGFEKVIALPGSKSITNRALALAAMCDDPSIINNPLKSDDTEAFVKALNDMGAIIEWENGDVKIVKPLPIENSSSVYCKDAGTAARFLPPIAATLSSQVAFDASEQLRARPMQDLLIALRSQGASTEPKDATHLPFTISSTGLKGGDLEIAGNISSQFLSGLLMASPLARKKTTFHVTDLISKPYVDLTLSMMHEFGAAINREGYKKIEIENQGRYIAPELGYNVEADASTASYFFAAALVTGSKITVSNICRDSLQGDIRLLDIFELMGAQIIDDDDGVTLIGPKEFTGVDVDMNDITDVMMTLACVAPLAKTPTRIHNVGHARYKESDRIDAVVKGLSTLGIKVEEGNDWLIIHPGSPKFASIDTFEDHRIAMSFTVLGLATGQVEIQNPDCVKKTCPNFFELIEQLN